MNKSQRIRVDVGITSSHYIKTRLEQDVKTLEILSLQIDQKDIYQNFNSDYGVLIGRVYANGEVGIPNAKVSIFIPISEEDQDNSDIVAAYPYEKPYDLNRDGKRYNLLPRVGRQDPNAGNSIKPKQPFGSLPIKEEFVTNETWLEVYDKYYKYSTITNNSGDYMLFGLPVGVQTVHMSVDITDIGKYSMSPLDMVTQLGYSENLFTETGDIKPQRNLDDLPNIETQEISVDVVPFWGDSTNFDIGITRQDFRIRAVLVSNAIIFGSYFTMGRESVNGNPDAASVNPSNNAFDDAWYRIGKYSDGEYNNDVDFRTNRGGELFVSVYYYPERIDQDTIDIDIATSGTTIDPQTDLIRLDTSSYNFYNDGNAYVISIPCNRRKIITDEFGNETVVDSDNPNGVFTEFLGMMFFEIEDLVITKTYDNDWQQPGVGSGYASRFARLRFKFPQDVYSIRAQEDDYTDRKEESEIWRKKYHKFESGKIYTTSQFIPIRNPQDGIKENPDDSGSANSFYQQSSTVIQPNLDRISGVLKVGGEDLTIQGDLDNLNLLYEDNNEFIYDMPWTFSALTTNGIVDPGGTVVSYYFGGQWLNMGIYFPQINWVRGRTANDDRDQNTGDLWFIDYRDGNEDGNAGEWFLEGGSSRQLLVGGDINTSYLGRADSLSTSFSEVPKQDIVNFHSIDRKGLSEYDLQQSGITLTGNYMYRTPSASGNDVDRNNRHAAYKDEAWDTRYYSGTYVTNPMFFKGMYESDCIDLLFDLNYI